MKMVMNSALSSWDKAGWVEIGRFMAYFPLALLRKQILENEHIREFFVFHDIESLDDKRLKFLIVGSQVSILLDLQLRRHQIRPSGNTKASSKRRPRGQRG